MRGRDQEFYIKLHVFSLIYKQTSAEPVYPKVGSYTYLPGGSSAT